jgi:hypothetical protein
MTKNTIDWNKASVKYLVGTHPKIFKPPHNLIYIEKIIFSDETHKWIVRWDGSALTRKTEPFEKHEFLIEKDFRGEEKKLIHFDTKEEALEAYQTWVNEKGYENDMG